MCPWRSLAIILVLILNSEAREITEDVYDNHEMMPNDRPMAMKLFEYYNLLDIDNKHIPLGDNQGELGAALKSLSLVSMGNRTQRFLFDSIFGLEVPLLEEQSVEDDEEEPEIKNCPCECGRANPLPRKIDCGGPNQENRIVGGVPAGLNRYPWMARLVYNGQFHCGASLLTKDYVVTAAHCVRKLKRSKIRVILGDHDQTITTESAAIMRAVSAIIRHRSFDPDSYNNDIALLKLRKPVTFSKIIKPVCLPPSGIEPSGKQGIVVGWGRTSEGGQLPAVVQEVRVPILSLKQCRSTKYRASRITNNMLCAGRPSTDSCQGDSGGPLLLEQGDKYQLIGIVSWGVGCGRPGYPGVYTRINNYLGWLRSNLQNTCLCNN